nr:MAG TPA: RECOMBINATION ENDONUCLEASE VII [Caudoviricetes sp.]
MATAQKSAIYTAQSVILKVAYIVNPNLSSKSGTGELTMAISKSKREAVYRKYDGHCAYCGREIAYKDMQVDHFQPLRAWGIEDAGTDDLDNLMPACRMCNHYKRANSLETFRRYIAEITRKLRENYIYKVGIVYGEIAEQTHPVKFYFEQQEATKDV